MGPLKCGKECEYIPGAVSTSGGFMARSAITACRADVKEPEVGCATDTPADAADDTDADSESDAESETDADADAVPAGKLLAGMRPLDSTSAVLAGPACLGLRCTALRRVPPGKLVLPDCKSGHKLPAGV